MTEKKQKYSLFALLASLFACAVIFAVVFSGGGAVAKAASYESGGKTYYTEFDENDPSRTVNIESDENYAAKFGYDGYGKVYGKYSLPSAVDGWNNWQYDRLLRFGFVAESSDSAQYIIRFGGTALQGNENGTGWQSEYYTYRIDITKSGSGWSVKFTNGLYEGVGTSEPYSETVNADISFGTRYDISLGTVKLYESENSASDGAAAHRVIFRMKKADTQEPVVEFDRVFAGNAMVAKEAQTFNLRASSGSAQILTVSSREFYCASDIPTVKIQDRYSMNADGIALNETTLSNEHIYSWNGFAYDTIYKFGFSAAETAGGNGKFHLAIGGGGIWNSYGILFDYANGNFGFGTAVSNTHAADKTHNFAFEYGKVYTVESGLIKLYGSADTDAAPIGEELIISVSDGENTVSAKFKFTGDNRCSYNTNPNHGGFGICFGFYANNSNVNAAILPVDYQKDYVVVIVRPDGTKTLIDKISYGESYDFSEYGGEDAALYSLTGYNCILNGKAVKAAVSGVWTYDVQNKTGGEYRITLYPEYGACEFAIEYICANADAGSLKKVITADDGIILPAAPKTDGGYVFLGWYKDSEFTEKAGGIECNGANITLYGKVVRGYVVTVILPNGGTAELYAKNGTAADFSSVSVNGYNVDGWQKKSGDNWVAATIDEVFNADTQMRPVLSAAEYSITYELDGGVQTGNPSVYTTEDEITLEAAHKDGFIFAGFYDGDGNLISSINKGTTGNLNLQAKFVKDIIPASASAQLGGRTYVLPVPVLFGDGYYTVSVKLGDEESTVSDNGVVFEKAGVYTAEYEIYLPSGKVTRRTQITVTVPLAAKEPSSGGLPGWAIALIAIGCVVVAGGIGFGAYVLIKKKELFVKNKTE